MANNSYIPDRSSFDGTDTARYIWTELGLPEYALESLSLTGFGHGYKSSFKIGHFAQNTVALSALAAALVDSLRRDGEVRRVTVPLENACLEFISERLYILEKDGQKSSLSDGPPLPSIGGLHRARDGHVRIHDSFPHHRCGAITLLRRSETATREDVAWAVERWSAKQLEAAAYSKGLPIYRLRTYEEWDAHPQAQALPDCPLSVTQIADGANTGLPDHMWKGMDRCLRGLRVLDLSRVLAAPVAGRTLAGHGADVLWVTSPNLPDLPELDKDTARGKRTIQLDLDKPDDREILRTLAKDCDVFLQAYRPGALAKKGFSKDELVALNPNIIYATVSAFGSQGPWADRRGFDSLVQTCSGMNISEAAYFGNPGGQIARPAPCQPLDHGSGQLLAAGIAAAVYKRAKHGGSWLVEVSLAATMKYLRSLGQVGCGPEEQTGIVNAGERQYADRFEERDSGFGLLRALKPPAILEGAMPGFDVMPKPLGSDEPRWLT